MKFSAALSVGLAPVALAKAVHNVYPVRRDPNNAHNKQAHQSRNVLGGGIGGIVGSDLVGSNVVAADEALLAETGLILGSLNEIVVIWVNGGGGVPTTTINAVQTVTQTVTANGGAAAAPPPPPAVQTAAVGAGTGTTAVGASAVAGAAGATHTVTVGGPKGLQYEPSSITANVGDMVIFTFLSQNHTVTQSAFATPCELLAGGMDSGFQPNANNSVNPPPQVALQVMVSTPLWFYCRQTGHCGKGMTFSINPTAAKTQAMFQEMAIAQNGTGTGSAITGNGGGAAGSAGSSTGSTSSVGAGEAGTGDSSLTATLGGSGSTVATSALAPLGTGASVGATGSTGGTGVVTGSGTVNADGSCSCAVQCAAGSFPAVQAQGLGGFGGVPGALPTSAVAIK